MKKVLVLMVAVTLGLTTAVNAKNVPTIDVDASNDLKQEIANEIGYPKKAQNNLLEGDVWMKLKLNENSKVEVVELSSANQELVKIVEEELKDITVKANDNNTKNVFMMKIKFDLIGNE